MNETLEQTIKRLKISRGCTNRYCEAGRLEYERLDAMIEEMEKELKEKQDEQAKKEGTGKVD